MNNSVQWASLHSHDWFSLLDGVSSPLDNFTAAVDGNLAGIAITNHGNCSSAIKVLNSRKQYVETIKSKIGRSKDDREKEILAAKIELAKKIKLVIGNEFYLAVAEKENAHLVVLAKNLQGYKQLVKATSESTRRENFYRRPRLNFDQLASYSGNLVIIDGHPGSSLYNQIWLDVKASFNAESYEEAKTLVHYDWKKRVLAHASKFKDAFGDNYFLESQLIDKDRLPAAQIAVNIYRWLSKELQIKVVCTSDSHYPRGREDDQRVLLCSLMKTTLPKVRKSLSYDEDIGLGGFFRSNKYYTPTSEEMSVLHPEEEVQTSLDILSSIEEYDLSNKPIIPVFACPDGLSSNDYMKQLCREGWLTKLSHIHGEEKKLYGERMQEELGVLIGAGLADYFLLVRDIVEWVKRNDGMVGEGRGSIGGCLTAYLMGITALDSVNHKLTFSRFYNDGRNTKDNISLPDADIDVEPAFRVKILNYLKEQHGQKRVAQISTYGRLMGRACLSEVLTRHEAIPFDEIKRCTQFIPDESSISDELNEMKEDTGESSIIQWSIENNAKEMKEWVWQLDDGTLDGPLAHFFEQAIRIEGTYRHKSKHPGGIVIYPDDIENHMPVMYDSDGEAVISYDLKDCEKAGGVKMDILSSDILTKIKECAFAIENEFLLEVLNETQV